MGAAKLLIFEELTTQTARSSLFRRKASLMGGFNSLLRDN